MAKTEKRFLTEIMRLNLLDSGSEIRSHLHYAFSGADWTTRGGTACSLMGLGEVSLRGDIANFGLYKSLECTFEGSRIDRGTWASTTTDT